MTTKVFPRSLRTAGEGAGLPSVRFSIKIDLPTAEASFKSVQLYMPSGLQFTDGASYSGVELGLYQRCSKCKKLRRRDFFRRTSNSRFKNYR